MIRYPCNAPPPIAHDVLLFPSNGRHRSLAIPANGDSFDLSTGACRITRDAGGIRYDTRTATLIAGTSSPMDADGYTLTRLYRSRQSGWFLLFVDWWESFGFADDGFIAPIAPENVMTLASRMLAPGDCLPFLCRFYFEGWIPRDDASALHWAEAVLSGDDLIYVRARLDASGIAE